MREELIFTEDDLIYVLKRCHRDFMSIYAGETLTDDELLHVSELCKLASDYVLGKKG
ncbi:MAG: hypothetical protein NXI01_09255 [Gammaproteobacteria bacterium]|nr:hypothetical protein [Gammaproteobacteria bacterium]